MASSHSIPTSGDPDTTMLKSDIERFAHEEVALEKLLINTIPPKTNKKFVDPYPYNPNADGDEEEELKEKEDEETSQFERLLGKKHLKDTFEGDAGCLYKKPEILPRLFFVRASFCSKQNA